MRRLIGIALLLVFSLPLIAPALAQSSNGGTLPTCCRRNGAHHCAGMRQDGSAAHGFRLSAIPQHCPAWPPAITSAWHGDAYLHTASLIFAEIVSHPAVRQQTEARARVSLDSSRQERGPPTAKLL